MNEMLKLFILYQWFGCTFTSLENKDITHSVNWYEKYKENNISNLTTAPESSN